MIGRIVCELPPTDANRRNSEGSFITLKNGDILFAYSRYGGNSWADDAAADIYGILSSDNGDSFGEPFLIFSRQIAEAQNVMSVSLRRFKNGDLGLFYLAKRDNGLCLPHLIRSADEGKTWSEPIMCCEEQDRYCVVNDRVTEGKNGRLLMPASRHRVKSWKTVDGESRVQSCHRGVLTVFGSDDDGVSWKTLADGIEIPYSRGLTTGVQEPVLVQLPDGRLWCSIRNDSGKQYECFSNDNGETWTEPAPSWFTSPDSPLSAKFLSDGRLLAAWNPVPLYNGREKRIGGIWTAGRTPMVLATSTDGGRTFQNIKTVEDDPKSGFCYIAIHETSDGGILLGYSAGGPGDECCLNRQRIRKISLNEI